MPANEELIFDPDQGILRQCICINILDNSMPESDRQFSVQFSSSDPVMFVSNSASVIILDNDSGMVYYKSTENNGSLVITKKFFHSETHNSIFKSNYSLERRQLHSN